MEKKIIQQKIETGNLPMLSVCMITYGHEKYIEEAINGVLMQQCDFQIELIISNDASPDHTDIIIHDILKKHSKAHNIKYFHHKKNLGMMPNFKFSLEQCQGNYIAICEGDDFWTDKLKLQKQVDFLKKNKDCSVCFHNASVFYEDTKSTKLFVENYSQNIFTAHDILKKWLIPTASMLFVNILKNIKLPDFFIKATNGDLALQLILSEYGNFGLINEDMCTYRINGNSVSQTFFYDLKYKYDYIKQLKEMKSYFKGKYNKYFNNSILVHSQNIVIHYNTSHLIKQFFILLQMLSLDILRIKKNYHILLETSKIFTHNVLNKMKGKRNFINPY